MSARVTRLIAIPERMATMRCLICGGNYLDIDAASNDLPTPCHHCGEFRTEPAYDVEGKLMPEGWTWRSS